MPRSAIAAALLASSVVSLAAAGTASAAQRWASPAATATAGACTPSAACRLDVAVRQARAGDEVVVTPGDYAVDATLERDDAISLHGVPGQPRPRLIGAPQLRGPVLDLAGGSVRHLAIAARGDGVDADGLWLRSGVGEDLVLSSQASDGGEIAGSDAGTVLRDSTATTAGTGPDATGLELDKGGDRGRGVTVLNVTVTAPGAGATGVRCTATGSGATLVNAYVRGAGADVDARSGDARCTARNSDFRPALSPGLALGPGNATGDGAFADPAAGDFRPLAGSPTIDAGAPDPLLGSTDLAGCPRVLGAAPDIGAFEYAVPLGTCGAAPPAPPAAVPAPPAPAPAPVASHAPAPVIGTSVVVSASRGTVRVRLPHAKAFRTLTAATRVPVGSVLDARRGRVRLTSGIDRRGTRQTGSFWGARFAVGQRRHDRGMTTLAIAERATGCTRHASGAHAATTARRRTRHRRPHLWARDDHGRFRTRGSTSVATARGTAWLTQERCGGTLTRVAEGAVAVRDRVRGRTVLVRAGHAYLARHRG